MLLDVGDSHPLSLPFFPPSFLASFFPSLIHCVSWEAHLGDQTEVQAQRPLVKWKEDGLPCQKQDNRPAVESHVLTPHHQTEPSYLTKRFSLSGSGLLTQCIWSDLVSTREAVCWVDPCTSPSKEGDLAPANMCPGDCLPCLLPAEVLHFASRSPFLSADGCS